MIPVLRVTPSSSTSESASVAEVKSVRVDSSSFAGYRTLPPTGNVYISMVQDQEVDRKLVYQRMILISTMAG